MAEHGLTKAQREALKLLADANEPLGAWRRSNLRKGAPNPRPFKGLAPVSRVNIRAVNALCRLGFARCHTAPSWRWSPYTHDDTYTITEEGQARGS